MGVGIYLFVICRENTNTFIGMVKVALQFFPFLIELIFALFQHLVVVDDLMTDFSQFGIGEIDFVVIRLAVFGRDDKFVQAGYGFPETICQI